jgi:hypothetical protein
MKAPLLFAVTTTFITFFACQKEVKTKPVDFSGTEYKAMPYDSTNGKPNSMQKDVIAPEMTSFIGNSLPERKDLRTGNSELLNSNTTTDLRITQKSDVFLTFVSTGTKYKNAIGFYTYQTGTPPTTPKDIKTITYVFPNTGSGSPLKPGDKMKIGTFEPGTSIGLVLLKDAYQATTGKLNNNAVHFCYNDILNPEVDPKLKKHVVLANYPAENKILIGFEDIDRTDPECDHDFNDVVLYATIKQ